MERAPISETGRNVPVQCRRLVIGRLSAGGERLYAGGGPAGWLLVVAAVRSASQARHPVHVGGETIPMR